jgi:hypothetical protein
MIGSFSIAFIWGFVKYSDWRSIRDLTENCERKVTLFLSINKGKSFFDQKILFKFLDLIYSETI